MCNCNKKQILTTKIVPRATTQRSTQRSRTLYPKSKPYKPTNQPTNLPTNLSTRNIVNTKRVPPTTFASVRRQISRLPQNPRTPQPQNPRTPQTKRPSSTYYRNIGTINTYKQGIKPRRNVGSVTLQTPQPNKYSNLTPEQIQSWDRIHQMAVVATTPALKQDFNDYMMFLGDRFPCPMCASHIQEKLRTQPISILQPIYENNHDVSYARWAWEFHNEISTKLSKPTVSWDYYRGRYLPY